MKKQNTKAVITENFKSQNEQQLKKNINRIINEYILIKLKQSWRG